MGTDYYSYVIAGVSANKYISSLKYEEKTPAYLKIKGKEKEYIYNENGEPIFDVKIKTGWIFNSQIYKNWNELERALSLLRLGLTTQNNEHEIWEGDAMGLFVCECEGNTILDLNILRDKLIEAENILKSIEIDEKPQIINILHVDY